MYGKDILCRISKGAFQNKKYLIHGQHHLRFHNHASPSQAGYEVQL